MGQVVGCLPEIQRLQMKPGDDSLVKLTQLIASNQVEQFRLPNQKNMRKFGGVGFKVGQQAQHFQNVRIQVLGFLNDHQGFLALTMGSQKVAID
ncbi:MAG: hypothetical protein RL120_03560 [Gammaproteobacteria bacterium]